MNILRESSTDLPSHMVPPLAANMTAEERVACFRFLRGIAVEIDCTIKKLESIDSPSYRRVRDQMTEHWRWQLAGVKLAMFRTGVTD